jgi:protein-S-isoprenylcysteine O-methyltransferase Ste14
VGHPPILAGSLLLLAGLALMVQTIVLFISTGKGTLSPWDPPQALAVRGSYRYVRNPMISGVLTILLAEALIAGSLALLVYFLIATGRTHAGRRANAGERTQSYPNNILRILCVLGS